MFIVINCQSHNDREIMNVFICHIMTSNLPILCESSTTDFFRYLQLVTEGDESESQLLGYNSSSMSRDPNAGKTSCILVKLMIFRLRY